MKGLKRIATGPRRAASGSWPPSAGDANDWPDGIQRHAVLEYLADMLDELQSMAAGAREPALVYLIAMAAEHARDCAADPSPPEGG